MTTSAIVISGTSPAADGQSSTCVWHPFLPEPPDPVGAPLRALCRGHRWKAHLKWILAAAALSFTLGRAPDSIAGQVVLAILTVTLFLWSCVQIVRDARRCARHVSVPLMGHVGAKAYLVTMREHGLALLIHVMANGGTSRTMVFECPPPTLLFSSVQEWSRAVARLCTPRSRAALMTYWSARTELQWQAEQMMVFKKWAARGARPCAGRLNRWIDEHGSRNEAFTTFVRELAALAAESDGTIIATRQQQDKEVRLHRAKQEADAEARRLEKIRCEEEARERVAKWALYPRESGAEERAAHSRFVVQLNRLSTQVGALTDARDGFLSRQEWHQAARVERELAELRAELRRFEWLKPN